MTDNNWGIAPPEGVTVAFGARAILRNGQVDLLPDRMGFRGEPGPEREALRTFLQTTGDKVIRRLGACADPGLRERLVEIHDGFMVAVNTNASHGYLYIGVWSA